MLAELSVRDLGVIDSLTLVFESGMTALTGETGAGKTLLVEAIELLVGGRPDTVLVRPGADEAMIEGRFISDAGQEVVLSRVVPINGRSRAYVDGRMAPVSTLAELGRGLVDLHGQHAHQSLLSGAVQREALDRFGDLADQREALTEARREVHRLDELLSGLGGDPRSRAREIDLLRFQVGELGAAGLEAADEEASLSEEEDRLADVVAHREAGAAAYEALSGEGGATDTLAAAVAGLEGSAPFHATADRLRSALAEIGDAVSDLRQTTEALIDDPERLAEVRHRRQLLRDLRRKYGESLGDVIAYLGEASRRLLELESYDTRAAALEQQRENAEADVGRAAERLGQARRSAAPLLASAVETHLRQLALPRARFAVDVGTDRAGDDVVFGFSANPGEPVLPLAKIASGGELARTMLAARLVLSAGPSTLVFDEVDAGIGGEAAVAVGRALAALGAGGRQQVLVVTHLPQVAAFADHQLAIAKHETQGRTVARAALLDDEERVVEISRMLAGRPDSESARQHAAELLATGAGRRKRRS
jgi:DNA repair protein RecN (Recombination protein N)